MKTKNYSQSLLKVIEENVPALNLLTEDNFNSKPAGMHWSKKEILGHLIDSASNNHNRFVKIQFENLPYHVLGYMQDEWVDKNSYKTQTNEVLIRLWSAYNTHIAHVIENIPELKLSSVCVLKQDTKVTFEFLINDYIDHMIHHLEQIYSE